MHNVNILPMRVYQHVNKLHNTCMSSCKYCFLFLHCFVTIVCRALARLKRNLCTSRLWMRTRLAIMSHHISPNTSLPPHYVKYIHAAQWSRSAHPAYIHNQVSPYSCKILACCNILLPNNLIKSIEIWPMTARGHFLYHSLQKSLKFYL